MFSAMYPASQSVTAIGLDDHRAKYIDLRKGGFTDSANPYI